MSNLINSKDKIIVKDTNFKIKIGDIVIYPSHNNTYAHRVLMKINKTLLISGDNCRVYEIVKVSEVKGIVTGIIQESGSIKIFKNNKLIFALTIYIFLFTLLNNISLHYMVRFNKYNGNIAFIRNNLVNIRNKLQTEYLKKCCN